MEDDELQDDQADGTDGDDGAKSGSDNSAPPADEPTPKDDSKRISDLMSKWQSEEARANKAEAALKAALGGQPPAEDEDAKGDTALDEFREFARESARNTLFSSNPQLAAAGLTAEDITGATLAEMQASVKKHVTTISGLEGRLRNKILAEHGLSPEVATGAGTEKAPSFSTMTDKEFAEFLEKRAGGSF